MKPRNGWIWGGGGRLGAKRNQYTWDGGGDR